jgi:hypothetical protein
MPETSSPPLANDPSSRAPDGTILDLSSTQSTTGTPSATAETPNAQPATTPATPPAAPAVPESYTLTAPEGQTLDKTLVDSATPIFRELGLDNTAAQKLVDFYNGQMSKQADVARTAIVKMGETWSAETMANPKLGPHLDTIKADVGRGLDVLESKQPGIKSRFQSAMDQTMVGNHPAFIEAFWEFAKLAAPGAHVSGKSPSPLGQSADGTVAPKSAAASMYPHLVSKAS